MCGASFLYAFAAVALTEIGDKTMLGTVCFSAQTHRPFAVLIVSMLALCLATALTIAVGYFFGLLLPLDVLSWIAGVAFVVLGAYIVLHVETHADESCAPSHTLPGMFVTVLLSELGDKSQLAIFALSATEQFPLAVFAGATLGFLVVNLVGALFGNRLTTVVESGTVHYLTGLLFIAIGLLSLLGVI